LIRAAETWAARLDNGWRAPKLKWSTLAESDEQTNREVRMTPPDHSAAMIAAAIVRATT
jgi:hypothetical protein